jgi:cell division septation protein DedD
MNSKHYLIINVLLALSLTACTLPKAPISPEMKRINNQQEELVEIKETQGKLLASNEKLMAQVSEWKKSEANVQRLIAIEKELNLLIQQLNTITTEAEIASAASKTNVSETPSPAQAQPKYMLQLASLNNIYNVNKTWSELKAQQPALLKDLPAYSQQVEVNGKKYYRLKVGQFTSKSQAQQVCRQLTQKKVSCLLAPYSGSAL